jgi:hypothetical protein
MISRSRLERASIRSTMLSVRLRGVIILNRFDVSRIDRVRGVKQVVENGLHDEPAEGIVDNAFEIGEKSANRQADLILLSGLRQEASDIQRHIVFTSDTTTPYQRAFESYST